MRFRAVRFLTEVAERYVILVGDPAWKDRRFEHVTFPDRSRAWCWVIKDPEDPEMIRVALP